MPTRSALTFNLGKRIGDLALAARLPSCTTFKMIAPATGWADLA
jgi:hypothetical protein